MTRILLLREAIWKGTALFSATGLARQGQDLRDQGRPGPVGLDHQFNRLVAVDQGQGQGRERSDVRAGRGADRDLDAAPVEPPAPHQDLDRDLAPLGGVAGDDQVADRDVARDRGIADGQDVDRHPEPLVPFRNLVELARVRASAVGEDEHAEGGRLAEPGRQTLQGVPEPRLVVDRAGDFARRERRELPAEPIPIDLGHPGRIDRGFSLGQIASHLVEPGRRAFQAHAPRPVDQEHGRRPLARDMGLDRPDRVEQDQDQHGQRRPSERQQRQRLRVRRSRRPAGEHQEAEQPEPDRGGELDRVGTGPLHQTVPRPSVSGRTSTSSRIQDHSS